MRERFALRNQPDRLSFSRLFLRQRKVNFDIGLRKQSDQLNDGKLKAWQTRAEPPRKRLAKLVLTPRCLLFPLFLDTFAFARPKRSNASRRSSSKAKIHEPTSKVQRKNLLSQPVERAPLHPEDPRRLRVPLKLSRLRREFKPKSPRVLN